MYPYTLYKLVGSIRIHVNTCMYAYLHILCFFNLLYAISSYVHTTVGIIFTRAK
jgi:hypothetical protein